MNENNILPRHKRGEKETPEDRFFKIRNVLNIIFILSAIVGLVLYYFDNHTTGTIVILAAMAFKIIECCLRFFR